MTDPASLNDAVTQAMDAVLIGNEDIVEGLTVALLTRGHVLLEGVPGVAKTTIARLFGNAIGLEVNRIQMTPDVLPADITGTSVYREHTGTFELQRGPIFANLVIADEINRATPKTQSALLEAMQELQVTIDGDTQPVPQPFMLVATQNPVEMEGTFELPVAQRDRFQQKRTVTLPSRDHERALVDRFNADPLLGPDAIGSVLTPADVESARDAVTSVHVADALKEYVLDLVDATRSHPDVRHGASPRATITLVEAAKARAAINDREYVIPDDVKAMLGPVLAHRLVLGTEAELSDVHQTDVIEQLAAEVQAPGAEELEGDLARA